MKTFKIEDISIGYRGNTRPANSKLYQILRLMYFEAYLPFDWDNNSDFNTHFKLSMCKTVLIGLFDLAVASLIFIYFPLIHFIFVKDFDMKQLLDIGYYKKAFGDLQTTFLTKMGFFLFPLLIWWTYSLTGRQLVKLNKIMAQPWFHIQWRLPLLTAVLMIIGLGWHGVNVSLIFMKSEDINMALFITYFLVFGLFPILRLCLHIFNFDLLMIGLIEGWKRNKPDFKTDETTTYEEWKLKYNDCKDWVDYYNVIEGSMRHYLLHTVTLLVPTIITLTFLLLNLICSSNSGFQQENITMCLLLSGFGSHFIILSRICHTAFQQIIEVKKEIHLTPFIAPLTEEDECMIHNRRDILAALVDTTVPMNGNGFFDVNHESITALICTTVTYILVLIQFLTSEGSSQPNPPGNENITNEI